MKRLAVFLLSVATIFIAFTIAQVGGQQAPCVSGSASRLAPRRAVYQAIEPNSFTAAVSPGADRTWVELLFLSFTTLSSTGLSDVLPIKPFARSLVMIEQFAGVAYIAMVVSRLVGLLVVTRNEPKQQR